MLDFFPWKVNFAPSSSFHHFHFLSKKEEREVTSRLLYYVAGMKKESGWHDFPKEKSWQCVKLMTVEEVIIVIVKLFCENVQSFEI